MAQLYALFAGDSAAGECCASALKCEALLAAIGCWEGVHGDPPMNEAYHQSPLVRTNATRHRNMAAKSRAISVYGAILGLVLFTSVPAKAATLDYHFNFIGPDITGQGDIFVSSFVDVLGGHDIQSITGSTSVGPIGGLLGSATSTARLFTDPVTGLQFTYDDVLYTSGPAVDNDGLLFGFGSGLVGNLYYDPTAAQFHFFLSVSVDKFFIPGEPIEFQISQTPLPGTLPMFLTGLCGLWLVRLWLVRQRRSLMLQK
jgi:hypothetical protein